MSPYLIAQFLVMTIAIAFSCWLVFWTNSAVKFAQSRRQNPKSRIASEPWYPLWLRFEGMWLWVMIAFFLVNSRA
jgi:hypothetical protein